ncbi:MULTISPECIES: ABC transporter ATP-binding protein [Carboxydocella]|uniref:Putative ABC transport system ATP-binding protein n=2 Tax=Carboxydocella TaxID=178898 RepID=A0A1T4M3I6_9FIRM|nr:MULTISPECIES: ABC transporter ATP-binding protein [Carboxydocella]AVX21063.1 putative ABC transport system ATP-binding protein [Carboxydocella thermautotrophica]GAW28819.1 ABC transporter ATP-binding protein [Carboxydocella sp. ULO1]GAW32277.1 ABC transporter ATP-binding protein [Carboxydocella sp. JDF658]SJZ61502.1 putative ABC transport system ATP-binding protein [Carboxydocella sporoproducens DSM 16521]
MALIKAEKLRKEYSSGEDKVIALAEASFNVEAGEFLGIIGPSGSGKSTLLSILGGLNPPTSGKLEIDGIDVYSLDQEQLADFRSEYVGFVFQQFQLLPYLTALENVMLPLAISGRPKGEQRDMAALVLEKVGLGNKLNRLPNQLSGGEQERVAIARAIVNQPPIIFADEPTGALDSKTGQEIMELFQALNREGQTIIMVTHNLETLKYMHRALLIRDGLVEKVIKHESLGYCAQ